jgi:hypothetical protein
MQPDGEVEGTKLDQIRFIPLLETMLETRETIGLSMESQNRNFLQIRGAIGPDRFSDPIFF